MSPRLAAADAGEVQVEGVELSINDRTVDQSVVDARADAVMQVLNGRPLTVVAAEHSTPPRLLQRWVAQFVTGGNRALAAKTIADDRTIDNLLAVIAHEMRSPLTSAAMGLRLVTDPRLSSDRQVEISEAIARQLDLLTQLADDVLDGASVSLGKLKLTVEPVDLRELVEQVRHDLADERIAATQGLSGTIVADPRRLRQIVTNVLHNALRHGVGDVQLRVDRRHDRALLTVTNHAREAVSMADAHRWFEPFARSSTQTGHGLGLYVVRALTVAHAGTAGVDGLVCGECAVGQDLQLWIDLPVAGPPPDDAPSATTPTALPHQRPPGTSRVRPPKET